MFDVPDIFSRFRPPSAPDEESSGSRRAVGGIAQVSEREVLEAIDRAPALPQVVAQLLQRLGDTTSSTADLERLIEQDMVLAGKVLKLVNSPFYGRAQPVASIREAVAVIGFASVRSIVLAASTDGLLMVDAQAYGLQPGGLWRQAVATAAVARAIAQRGGAPLTTVEVCFAAGLLRDVGMLILAPFLTRSGIRLQRDEGHLLTRERRAIGYDHSWAGERLAEKWRLPPVLHHCIARHHRSPADDDEPTLGVVRLAERLVFAAGVGVAPEHPFDLRIDARLIKRAGLDAAQFAALCAEVPQLVKQAEALG